MRISSVALLLLLVAAGCGGGPESQLQDDAPEPSPQYDEEVVYVGSASGGISAFAVNEETGAVRRLGSGSVSGHIRRLRVSDDGRHLFAEASPAPHEPRASVLHVPLAADGAISGAAAELATNVDGFELAPGSRYLLTHRLFYVWGEGDEIIDSRSQIATLRLEFAGGGVQATPTAEFNHRHCDHPFCFVGFRFVETVQAGGQSLVWAWDNRSARIYVNSAYVPLAIGPDGTLSDTGTRALISDYYVQAEAVSERWVVAGGYSDVVPAPQLFVSEIDSGVIQPRKGCFGADAFDPGGSPGEHEACAQVPQALQLRGNTLFLADGESRIWSLSLHPGSGIDLSTAKAAQAPVLVRSILITPNGRFLFALGDGVLMGFQIQADTSLQALPGSPWPVDGGTAMSAGNPDGR